MPKVNKELEIQQTRVFLRDGISQKLVGYDEYGNPRNPDAEDGRTPYIILGNIFEDMRQ